MLFICFFLQPGAPCIYYGTEVGLSGGEEPGCRECFPWQEYWDVDLRIFIRSLVDLRKNVPEIFNGALIWESIGEDGILGHDKNEANSTHPSKVSILVFVNRSRNFWMPIHSVSGECLFLEGKVDFFKRSLSPQSFVMFKGAFGD